MQQYIEFITNHWDLFLALALILAMIFGGGIMSRLRGFKNIEPFQAVQFMNHDDALLVDVREEREVKEGIIRDARHIPLGKLKQNLNELENYKEKPIIVACRSGHRSATACAMLRKEGFATVYNLRGGVMAWQSAGLPLHKEGSDKKKRKK